MNNQEKVAEKVFAQHGYDFSNSARAGGWTNAVWLNNDAVIRVSGEKGSNRIRREAETAKHLPPQVGYPQIIAVGVTDDLEWSLSKRIYADNLSDVWDTLNWSEKEAAVKKIIGIANAVHSVDAEKVRPFVLSRTWYSSLLQSETDTRLEFYKTKNIFTSKQIDNISKLLREYWGNRDKIKEVLVHGDVTTDNLLCHRSDIVSLMDFEHSAILPAEVDIHNIINLALLNVDSDSSDEYKQYKSNILHEIEHMNYSAKDIDILTSFAILFRMRFLDMWFDDQDCELEEHSAYRELKMIADGAKYPYDFAK